MFPENSFFRRQMTMLVALVLYLFTPVLLAGEQADRAISAVQQLKQQDSLAGDTTLSIMVKQGNVANFLGENHLLKQLWEAQTGISLDVQVMPQQASLEVVRHSHNIDLTIARNREYADLRNEGLIADLTPFYQRYGFELGGGDEAYVLPKMQAYLGDRIVAVPADGDIAILYLRHDLLEDPDHQVGYRERFKQPLRVPETWQEYQQQIEYFHGIEPGFSGSLEQRNEQAGWMFWMPRYAAQSMPNQYLFDDQMKPLVNSVEGIAATESYLATVEFSPKGILDQGNGYTFTLPQFILGKGYSTVITLAGAKLFNGINSKVKGKYIAVPMPGKQINGQVHRRTTLIYGNNIVIPSKSKNADLAFLFAMWLTDPDISVKSVAVTGGFADPYRQHHYSHPELINTYSESVLKAVSDQLNQVVPAGTGLPGDKEYIAVLNKELHRAALGRQSAAKAMANVEQAWEAITERFGREAQRQRWLEIKQNYPGATAR